MFKDIPLGGRDALLNGGDMGFGAERSAGPSCVPTIGGSGTAMVTTDSVLDVNAATDGSTVGGNGVDGSIQLIPRLRGETSYVDRRLKRHVT